VRGVPARAGTAGEDPASADDVELGYDPVG
jgi:hypothetical protein